MFAGWGPMGDLFYGTLVLLLENPETHQLLTKEVRDTFSGYEDIIQVPKLTSLPYLHACIEETLRMLPSNNTGLPRTSPGTMVDGQHIPKGVSAVSYLPTFSQEYISPADTSTHRRTYSPAFGRWHVIRTISTNHSASDRNAGCLLPIHVTTRLSPTTTSRACTRSASARGYVWAERRRGRRRSYSWPRSSGRLMWSE